MQQRPFCLWFFAHPPLMRLTDSSTSGLSLRMSNLQRRLKRRTDDPLCNNDLFACGSLLILPFCNLPIPRPQQVGAILLGKGAWQQWLLTLKSADPICNDDLFASDSMLILLLVRLTDSSTSAGRSESARKKAFAKWLLTLNSADPKCNDDFLSVVLGSSSPSPTYRFPRPQQGQTSQLRKRPWQSGF
jgi:hypothetical protein